VRSFFSSYQSLLKDLASACIDRSETVAAANPSSAGFPSHFPRTQTVEFAPDPEYRGKFDRGGMLERGPLRKVPKRVLSPEHSRFFLLISDDRAKFLIRVG